ncbi:MAG: hypothetical protein GXO79_03035 [Chlorobi bacterium]|nr:hypothetical protein [Chlorobiota bacterium]
MDRKFLKIFLFIGFAFIIIQNLYAFNTVYDTTKIFKNVIPKLFETDKVLELTIITDLKGIKKDIGELRSYHKAIIKYYDVDSVVVQTKAKIRTRGRIRRSKNVCNFPPLKVKMKINSVIGTIFEGNESFKIVTHCQTSKEVYQQYIILEYLIYKMYQLITDKAFQVRLAKITYEDVNNPQKTIEKYGILLEMDEHLANRLGGSILEVKNIHPDYTAPTEMNRLALFEYMIGNTDWSVKALHNIKLLFRTNSAPIAIPFDFDYAGLVNTCYAVPAEEIKISSVRERYYNGYFVKQKKLEENLEFFKQKQSDIINILENCPQLDTKLKTKNIKYLEEFFEIINNQKKVKQIFINHCRTD